MKKNRITLRLNKLIMNSLSSKITILTLSSLTFLLGCNKLDDNLTGSIESIFEKSYKAIEENGEIVKGIQNKYSKLSRYDRNGLLVEEIAYENNEIDYSIKYKYNSNNQLLLEQKYNPYNIKISQIDYLYNEGQLVKV